MSQTAPVAERPSSSQPAGDAILRATGLRKHFQMGDSTVEVLKDLELSVVRGEFVAIEGRSGSGKSTLLHVLAGLDAADEGRIEVDGVEIGELALRVERRRHRFRAGLRFLPGSRALMDLVTLATDTADRRLARIRNTRFGFVFQFYHLLPELNVLENTMLAPMIEHSWLRFRAGRRQHRERAEQVLADLGMSHRLTHRPNQLSGGERQRVAIARALMNRPKILFADEPTGNLDADTGKQIMGVLERLHREQGQTIVMVTHDRGLARKTDRVLVMKHGKLEPAEG